MLIRKRSGISLSCALSSVIKVTTFILMCLIGYVIMPVRFIVNGSITSEEKNDKEWRNVVWFQGLMR